MTVTNYIIALIIRVIFLKYASVWAILSPKTDNIWVYYLWEGPMGTHVFGATTALVGAWVNPIGYLYPQTITLLFCF